MSIGALAAATGVSVRSLRYYEQQGLLESERSAAGHRRFAPGSAERVILIQHLFAAGLSSRTIAPMLPCMVDASLRTPLLIEDLRAHRDRLEREIRRQQETVRILDQVIGAYRQSPTVEA
ncbi:MerR family transcriptional regulator [Sediminivirga luteola]|nr:MerR family transcriptional regulator [Sediminivirga luteola]